MNGKWYILVTILFSWMYAFTFHDNLIPMTFGGETLDKPFLGDQLKVTYTSMMDIADYTGIQGIAGSLTEIRMEYSLTQDLQSLLSLTQVNGSNEHPDGEDYPFTRMEDFSHIRFELKYFF